MASPPPNVLRLRGKFEGCDKAEFNIASHASETTNKLAVSTTRKYEALKSPNGDGNGSGRAFMLVSSSPRQTRKLGSSSNVSTNDKAAVHKIPTISNPRQDVPKSTTVKVPGIGKRLDFPVEVESPTGPPKPALPSKPTSIAFLKRSSISLVKWVSVEKENKEKDSEPTFPQRSSPPLKEEATPLSVANRARRFAEGDKAVKSHHPPLRRPVETGTRAGAVPKWGWSVSTDNEESDDRSDIEGTSPTTLVIPLSENPLLQNEFLPGNEHRRSSDNHLLTGTANISNARGLFQKALLITGEPLQTTAKPPVPDKPLIFKKPLPNSASPSGNNSKPSVPPKANFAVPPPNRHHAVKFTGGSAPRKPLMENSNIYDEVYQEAPAPPETDIPILKRSSKKLESFFGEVVHGSGVEQSASSTFGKNKMGGKVNQSAKNMVKKISSPLQSHMAVPNDGNGPYAIIPIPDVDKTAAKKPNQSDMRLRKTSDGSGKPMLRNSGGMSSGDSGVGFHSDITGQERKMKHRDRRMSRRIIREQMRSLDSDFAEDSDDEPIGTESDFDSDGSEDRLVDQVTEPMHFLDESHKKAYEVLTTERTYVEKLYLIDQIFYEQIRTKNETQSWFPPSVPKEIFSNISTIFRLHSDVILRDLEKQLKEWDTNPCLGEVMKNNAPFLKLYSDYVSNFDHAMKQLNLWTSKVPKFAAALSEMQKHPRCGNLALQHHMLTPVQRLPRYELLLKEYLKKLPCDARDRPSAEKALRIISGAAQHSNDMMKSMDQFEKLLKINEKIESEVIIDPTRHLLKEGKITKITNKSKDPQDRYIFLFNDILLCCEKKRLLTANVSYKVKLKLEVDGMKVSLLDSDSCRFIIEGKTKSIELQTNTEEEREEWMAALLSAIREMVRKKESFKTNDAVGDRQNGEDSSENDKFVPGKCEPRWIKDDDTTMCMRCGSDFRLTKRRHHCRACGAVICSKCSSYEMPLQYDNSKMNKVCSKCYFTLKEDHDELKRIVRTSLITELNDEISFGSFLYLQQKGTWNKYWVIVTDQDLFALKAPKDVRSVVTLPIKLYSASDVDSSTLDKDNVFKLSDGKKLTYIFAAESKELKKRWLSVLTNGLEDAASRSQTI